MIEMLRAGIVVEEQGAATVKAAIDKLNRSFRESIGAAQAYDSAVGSLKNAFVDLVGGIAIAELVHRTVQRAVQETADAEYAQAQLAATLKSTKNAAGQSADALNAHAAALARITAFDDDAITAAQALLLTFTRISGDTFPKATEAVLNVAQAMGTDLKSAAVQVGKALNDPVLGVTALARAGIQFTDAQRELIKSLVDSNRLMEAQTIVLKELETQFGGSSEAARNTFGGSLKGLSNDFGNLITLSGDGANLATKAVNYLASIVRGYRRDIELIALAWQRVGNYATTALKILNAMQGKGSLLGPDTPDWPKLGDDLAAYSKFYSETIDKMRQKNFELSQSWEQTIDPAKALDVQSRAASEYITKLTGSAIGAASGFGLMTDAVFKTTAAVRNIGAAPTKIKEKVEEDKGVLAAFERWMDDYRERQRTKARDAIVARNVGGVTTGGAMQGPAAVTQVAPAIVSQIQGATQMAKAQADLAILTTTEQIRESMAESFGHALSNGIVQGFQTAFQTGSIGAGFKALAGNMISGLGSMMVAFGTKALVAAESIRALWKWISAPGGMGVAAALAIIAVGAGLQAAGQTIFGGRGATTGGGVGGGYAVGGVGGGMVGGLGNLGVVNYGPTMAGSASREVQARTPVAFTVIGPNDPSAQRAIQELLRNADRRGNVFSS